MNGFKPLWLGISDSTMTLELVHKLTEATAGLMFAMHAACSLPVCCDKYNPYATLHVKAYIAQWCAEITCADYGKPRQGSTRLAGTQIQFISC